MITMYTRDGCDLCTAAKAVLNHENIPFTEIQIGVDISRDEVKAMYPQVVYLPVIVLDNEYLGGYNELLNHLKESKEGQ